MREELGDGGRWAPRAAVAVLGGAAVFTDDQLRAGFLVGRTIARHGKILITGATGGIPLAAALGAHKEGGFVVGVSPGRDAADHVRVYGKPLEQADLMVFTGLGLDGRSPIIMRSAAGAIFIGGEFGTLGEFCCGWQSTAPKVLGIVEGLGGLTDELQRLVPLTATKWTSRLVVERDPVVLTRTVCVEVDELSQEQVPDPDVALRERILGLVPSHTPSDDLC